MTLGSVMSVAISSKRASRPSRRCNKGESAIKFCVISRNFVQRYKNFTTFASSLRHNVDKEWTKADVLTPFNYLTLFNYFTSYIYLTPFNY